MLKSWHSENCTCSWNSYIPIFKVISEQKKSYLLIFNHLWYVFILNFIFICFVIKFHIYMFVSHLWKNEAIYEPWHEISNNVLCATSKVSKGAKTRNWHNQVPHLTQDTNGKVTNSQLDTTNESQEVSPLPAGDQKAHINRCTAWSEPLLVAWIFYECKATDWTSFGVSKLKRRLHKLIWVYTCQNGTSLEIKCRGSYRSCYCRNESHICINSACVTVANVYETFKTGCQYYKQKPSYTVTRKFHICRPQTNPLYHEEKQTATWQQEHN